jgi:hypothetical protein
MDTLNNLELKDMEYFKIYELCLIDIIELMFNYPFGIDTVMNIMIYDDKITCTTIYCSRIQEITLDKFWINIFYGYYITIYNYYIDDKKIHF